MDHQGDPIGPFHRPTSVVLEDIQKVKMLIQEKEIQIKLEHERAMQLEREMKQHHQQIRQFELELKNSEAREKFQAKVTNLLASSDVEEITRECELQLYDFINGFDGHQLIVNLLDALQVPAQQREMILRDTASKLQRY